MLKDCSQVMNDVGCKLTVGVGFMQRVGKVSRFCLRTYLLDSHQDGSGKPQQAEVALAPNAAEHCCS